jgi:hypothetical protein
LASIIARTRFAVTPQRLAASDVLMDLHGPV